MPAFTAQALIDRAAAISDMHDGFVTPAQWLAWLNTEIRALDIFTARNGYVLSTPTSTSTSAAPYTIEVSGEMLAVLGVWEVRDTRYRRLTLQNPIDFQRQDNATGTNTGEARYYSVVRTPGADTHTIYLYPRPTSGTYMALTLPVSTLASTVATSLWYPLGFEERLVLGMARKAMVKDESDESGLIRLIREQEQLIEEACWSRQIGEAPRVRNVDDTERGWSNYPDWPPYATWFWL